MTSHSRRTLGAMLVALAALSSGPSLRGQAAARESASPAPPPPASRVEDVVDTLHGVPVPDPYRWLERQDDPDTRQWITAQNGYAERIVPPSALRTRLETRLRDLMARPEIGDPQRAGAFEYFTLRRPHEDLPILYRRPVRAQGPANAPRGSEPPPEPIDPAGDYEVVIDPHPMSADHTTRVEVMAFESNGNRLVYGIRDGGQDEIEIRVRDLRSGQDLPDRLPAALYSGVSFEEDGTGFFYSRRSRETGARVRFHRFGEDAARDAVLFGDGYGPECFVTMTQGQHGRYRLYTVQRGWASTDVFVQDRERGAAVQPVVVGAAARFYPQFVDGQLWMRTDLDASNNRLVAVDLGDPAGERWKTVVPESADVMDDFRVVEDRVFVTYLHDVSSVVRVFKKDGTPDGTVAVPPFHAASVRPGGKGHVLLALESFLAPRQTWRVELATGARTPHQVTSIPWDASKVSVEQVWVTSKDGTRLPMFLVHRTDLRRDGARATLLHGYGGFYAASRPSFNDMAAAWVESGGVYAVANMRGGSEYGERWHRAGMLLNKQNVFDDFIAAGEWLVASGYTNPSRLAIWGVSNGGLLVGAALTQRPDLFRAVLCRFPDVDILRFYTYTRNNNMPALLEYGNATVPEQFEAIRRYSPYQNVRAGTAYPAVMVVSGDLDTRVPPLAARKFVARLQASTTSGRPVILRYQPKAGHAANNGLPLGVRVRDTAMELAFLMEQVGLGAAGSH